MSLVVIVYKSQTSSSALISKSLFAPMLNPSSPFFHSPLHLLSFVTYNFLLSFLCIYNSPLHFSQDMFSSHYFVATICGFNIGKHRPFPSFATLVSHVKHKQCKMGFWCATKLSMNPVCAKLKWYFQFQASLGHNVIFSCPLIDIVLWIGQTSVSSVVYVRH